MIIGGLQYGINKRYIAVFQHLSDRMMIGRQGVASHEKIFISDRRLIVPRHINAIPFPVCHFYIIPHMRFPSACPGYRHAWNAHLIAENLESLGIPFANKRVLCLSEKKGRGGAGIGIGFIITVFGSGTVVGRIPAHIIMYRFHRAVP